MKAHAILAIDPGASGGLAFFINGSVNAWAMPSVDEGVLDQLTQCHRECLVAKVCPVAVVEQVNGYMGNAAPGSRMFNFGEGYGFLRGALKAMHWRVDFVTPRTWQKGLCLDKDGMGKSHWKRTLQAEAKRYFPDLKPTLKTADALLIGKWAVDFLGLL